jgi:hypothetical protein
VVRRGEDLRRLKDKACWENEVGCPMPVVDGLGTKKILTIVKPGR